MGRKTGNPEDVVAVDGAVLKQFRRTQQLSQQKLGDLISLNKSSISRLENGEIKVGRDTAYRIADELKMDISQLVPELTMKGTEVNTLAVIENNANTSGDGFAADPFSFATIASGDYQTALQVYNVVFTRIRAQMEDIERKERAMAKRRQVFFQELEDMEQELEKLAESMQSQLDELKRLGDFARRHRPIKRSNRRYASGDQFALQLLPESKGDD